jgi:hypothetical protein
VLPIAILAVPFLVRYAVAEKGGCPKTFADTVSCPEPATTVDCTKLGVGVCESQMGQKKENDEWGERPSTTLVYAKPGVSPTDDRTCYTEYQCVLQIDGFCGFDLMTGISHDKTLNVTVNCP